MPKKIIIVGASSGIGRELALKYAAQGHKVGITARRSLLLNELHLQFPGNIFTSCFDVTSDGNEKKIHSLIDEMGGMDLLIYCSGFGEPSKQLQPDVEMLTTATNVNGFVSIAVIAFNFFEKQGFGQIVVISSVAAVRGNSWAPSYNASKAFVSSYAESLNLKAHRLKKDIRITDIRPGFVDTKMSKGNGQFWVASVSKAAGQIMKAIDSKKRVAYITRRWWLIAQLMRLLPYSIFKRIV